MRWSSESCGRLRATCQIARADDLRGEVLVDGSAAFRLPGGVGERCGGGAQLFAEPLHGRVALAARMPEHLNVCLLYTSDAADERSSVDLGGRRIIKKKKKQ